VNLSAPATIEWREIPSGAFAMGSDPAAAFAPDADEAPRHRVRCAPFRIGRTPVTNAQYAAFVDACGYRSPSHWPDGVIPAGRELHPVTYVSWQDAVAFCRWAGGSLPSEAQWERAARGDDGRAWPWGDEAPTAERAAFGTTDTAPVGSHPRGAGPFGALDLAGNAWEWTTSALRPYPYDPEDGREVALGGEPRVVRGGAYIHGPGEVRSSYRHGMVPGAVDHYVGFRLVAQSADRLTLAIETVEVPEGDVVLGNDPRPAAGLSMPDEAPQHIVCLASLLMAATPVTNAQYAEFVAATGHPVPPHWFEGTSPEELAEHPVTHVDWHDARDFCRWAGARLPTEAEWEKAVRGSDARVYPWGNDEPLPAFANVGGGPKHGRTTVVTAHPAGASPYGLLDAAGNVWEWVSSVYAPYPYDQGDGREDPEPGAPRALRGGSYASPGPQHVRCAARSSSAPGRRSPHIGFRAARDISPTERHVR
jgi:formylglycine-generating enzyme required for sulfatase activity